MAPSAADEPCPATTAPAFAVHMGVPKAADDSRIHTTIKYVTHPKYRFPDKLMAWVDVPAGRDGQVVYASTAS